MSSTETTPLIQNFSVPAGDAMQVNFNVDPDGAISLLGSNIEWNVYKQQHGVITDQTPILTKTLDNGLQIDDPLTWTFHVTLLEADTIDLLGNYRHSGKVTIEGSKITVVDGVMCVTESK